MSADNILFGKLFDKVNIGTPNNIEAEWRYLDMQIWPIVKSQIIMRGSNVLFAGREMSLAKNKGAKVPDDSPKGFFRRFFETPEKLPVPPQDDGGLFDSLDWPEFPGGSDKAADILCLGYATNHKEFGQTYFQLCMDPCRLAFEARGYSSVCIIAGMAANADGVKAAALQPTYGMDAEIRTVRRLASKLPDVNLRGCEGFMDWWDALNDLLGEKQFTTIEHIENVIKQTRVVGEWLYRSFRKAPPKAVLVAAYYGLVGHGSSWAFRRLGVAIGDIQHGVAGPGHHAYSWPTAPAESYNTLPTHFLVWSDREYRHMSSSSGSWQPNMILLGNIWRLLDDVLGYEDSESLFDSAQRISAKNAMQTFEQQFNQIQNSGHKDGKDILIALHPDEDLDWFIRFKAASPDNWRFYIRLHPGEYLKAGKMDARIKAHGSSDTKVKLPTIAPLNIVLGKCDAILTKYSSVAQDALAYGVPTVAYSDAATHFFGPPNVSQIRVVLPYPESMVTGLKQRLSVYGSGLLAKQEDCDFQVLGQALTISMITQKDDIENDDRN